MEPQPSRPGEPYDQIARLLAKAQRKRIWARARGGLGGGLLASGLWALAAALLGKGLGLGDGVWPLLALPLLAALLALALGRLGAGPPTLVLPDTALRSALRSAVELHGALAAAEPTQRPSPELVAAHAGMTAARLPEIDLARALPSRAANTILLAGLALGALDLALAWVGPVGISTGFRALTSTRVAARAAAESEPITGDIELTYLFPAHTHLTTRTVSGTDGAINAPTGTEVRLKTRADRDVTGAAVVANGDVVALSVAERRELTGTLQCRKSGSYFFRFLDGHGRVVADGPPIPIALQADAPPQISIESPAAELEIDPGSQVPIRYRASDDYGLSELALLYKSPGSPTETRAVLRRSPEEPHHLEGEASFDLRPLHLAPGDVVTYTLEALDNDSVDGPKATRASGHKLKVFSEAEHHREALEATRTLWERLVLLLGDRIDEKTSSVVAAGDATTDGRALSLCDAFEAAARKLRKDAASPPALATALANIARGERERASATLDAREYSSRGPKGTRSAPLAAAIDEEVGELEKDVLYLEAMLDRQTMQDLVALMHEMGSRRRELADLIEKFRKSRTPELRAAVAAQLARLRERVGELLSRMSELAHGLSDEHLNHQALEQLSKDKDVVSGISDVEKQLAQGDVDGALKTLDQLGNAMDQMQRRLEKAAGQSGQQYPELARKVSAFSHDLDQLADDERKLARETEEVRQRYRKALEQHAPASQQLVAKLREEAAKAKAQLDQIPQNAIPPGLLGEDALGTARDKVEELQRALAVKDFDQAMHSAQQAAASAQEIASGLSREAEIAHAYAGGFAPELPDAERLAQAHGHAQAAVPPLDHIRDALSKLFPDQDTLVSPADRERLRDMAQRQSKIRERLGEAQRDLQSVQQTAPIFDPSAQRKLEQAGGQMKGAQQSLGGRRPSRAEEQEQGALQQLDGLQQTLKQMASQGRGGSAKGQGDSPGFPNPFDMGGEGEGGGQEGALGSADEKVIIPGADQYQVPPEFRRDILDAMRQKPPAQFEDQVKKYYQEIVK